MTVPWTCDAATSRRPSGLQRSHRPTPAPTGAPQRAQPWVGSGLAGLGTGAWLVGAVGVTVRWCHEPGRRGASVTSAATASTRASTSSVVRARTIAPSAPASCQRSQVARGSWNQPVSRNDSSPSQSPWKPTRTVWSLATPSAGLERLEVERQVRLEVVVERVPAVADARRQPRPGRRLATDDDRAAPDRAPGARRPRSAGSTATAA